MSLWDFVGGAADAVLDKRKRDMAAQLQKDLEEQRKNFQMALEQQRAERDFDKEKIRAESEMLNRKREDERYTQESAERAKQRQADEAYRNRALSIQESNAAASAAERKAAAEERRLYQQGLAAQAKARALNQEVSSIEKDIISTFGVEDKSGQKTPKDLPNDLVVLLQEARDAAAIGDEEAAQAAINALRTRRYKPTASSQTSPPITTGMQPR